MNPQQRRLLIAVCFGMVVGPVFGPRLGDWVARFDDGIFWQVLPWLLVVGIWAFLLGRARRVPPAAR